MEGEQSRRGDHWCLRTRLLVTHSASGSTANAPSRCTQKQLSTTAASPPACPARQRSSGVLSALRCTGRRACPAQAPARKGMQRDVRACCSRGGASARQAACRHGSPSVLLVFPATLGAAAVRLRNSLCCMVFNTLQRSPLERSPASGQSGSAPAWCCRPCYACRPASCGDAERVECGRTVGVTEWTLDENG